MQSLGDVYTFDGTAGQVVTIAHDGVLLVDPCLLLVGPDGTVVVEDDDGGHGLSSRISGFALPTSGTYTIETTAFQGGQIGTYSLGLTNGAATLSSPLRTQTSEKTPRNKAPSRLKARRAAP